MIQDRDDIDRAIADFEKIEARQAKKAGDDDRVQEKALTVKFRSCARLARSSRIVRSVRFCSTAH